MFPLKCFYYIDVEPEPEVKLLKVDKPHAHEVKALKADKAHPAEASEPPKPVWKPGSILAFAINDGEPIAIIDDEVSRTVFVVCLDHINLGTTLP